MKKLRKKLAKNKGKVMHFGLAIVDVVLVVSAFAFSYYLRFDWDIPKIWKDQMNEILFPAALISLASYYLLGFYRRVWRYAGTNDLMLIVVGVSVGLAGTYIYSIFSGALPRSVYIISWFLLILMIGGSRIVVKVLAEYLGRPAGSSKKRKALVIGAGEAGVMVARELKKHGSSLGLKVAGFIDDDPVKQQQVIQGLKVLGNRKDLPRVIQEKQISEVIIAMPSAPYSTMQELITSCAVLPVKIKTVPGIYEIVKGQVSISSLKNVEIEDLLQRAPVETDISGIADYLTGKVVIVTGAAGSIGAELCRQIAELSPAILIMLDHDENGIFYINMEIKDRYPDLEVIPLVRDIQYKEPLSKVFTQFKPTVVFHAAAYKHVPLMETNAEEALRNNIHGSINLIDLAADHKVNHFVFVSTDKAVNPSSVMGATKRVVEIYMQKKARSCDSCVYCAVRFGNVLGSQGSVVHLFRRQIAKGGPITVTDPKMKRYFMTIPEAVQLVIQAGALGKGGEIFVLDMGEPIQIVDLARNMIILSGLKPEIDIKIIFSGLRPGEKLYEELFKDSENFALTRHERIFIAPDTECKEELILEEIYSLGNIIGIGTKLINIIYDDNLEKQNNFIGFNTNKD